MVYGQLFSGYQLNRNEERIGEGEHNLVDDNCKAKAAIGHSQTVITVQASSVDRALLYEVLYLNKNKHG